MPEPQPPNASRITIRDLWEIISLPLLLSSAVVAATWLVWYFTRTSCPPELANITGCNPGQIARYINLEVLSKILTHAAIAAGGGGIWSYIMITRERKARETAEKNLAQEREQSAAEREQAATERGQATAERAELLARLDEERAQSATERAQSADDRAELLARLDAERAQSADDRAELLARLDAAQTQAAEERRIFLATIERLTQQLNGGAPPASQ